MFQRDPGIWLCYSTETSHCASYGCRTFARSCPGGTCSTLRPSHLVTRRGVILAAPQASTTCRVLECLAQFGPSKTERLRIIGSSLMVLDGPAIRVAVPPMKNLRLITISRCKNLSPYICTLCGDEACQKFEELNLDFCVAGEKFDILGMIRMAAKRASRGAKLKSVRMVSRDRFMQVCASKPKKHALDVECGPRVAFGSGGIDGGDGRD